ncbi:hypothetical protein MPP7335_02366 [Mycolicibacterium parafortuitum]|uniref:Uncharacterized protein n=1 Tax=Mycolicibacterium parafortuitum TaxID=39692 RepID=A0A375YHL4_MYCPF|nr:hypothetical protein MPP7335_02366 [Mycolicibacterium parafortuitum]
MGIGEGSFSVVVLIITNRGVGAYDLIAVKPSIKMAIPTQSARYD